VYIKAFFNALLRRDVAWQATNSINSFDSPFNYIRMQTYVFAFLAVTTVVGIWKALYTDEFSISLVWCALNTLVFGSFVFVAIRESMQLSREAKAVKKSRQFSRSKVRKERPINPKARLKFTLGLMTAVLLGLVLFIYMEHSMSRVVSTDARLQSATFTVGVGYSGIIERQFIEEGDQIKAGDVLFELRSPTLSEALRSNEISQSSLLYEMTDDSKIKLSAAANGAVQKINYREGAFVPANSEIAVINAENALYVNAVFKLSPPDYAKVRNGNTMTVRLPDNTRINGPIYGITLEPASSQDRRIYTTVKMRVDQADINPLFTVGTPVEATLYLDTETWYNRITNILRSIFD
jgi:hypothetical protein